MPGLCLGLDIPLTEGAYLREAPPPLTDLRPECAQGLRIELFLDFLQILIPDGR